MMKLSQVFLLSFVFSVLFIHCDNCGDIVCTTIQPPTDIILVNENNQDLLDGVAPDSIANLSIKSLKAPNFQDIEFQISESTEFDSTLTARRLTIVNSDLYTENESGNLERTVWEMTYTRSGLEFTDTIAQTPAEISSECCLSLTISDFTYTGNNVVSVIPVERNSTLYKVTLR